MIAFAAAILVTSLLGSMHCVGMCGPMALWASGVGGTNASRRDVMFRLAGYHFGRLITFAFAGIAAGWIGGLMTTGGDWMGWQQTAARIGGSAMVGLGVWKLLNWLRPINEPQSVSGRDSGNASRPNLGQRFSLWVSSRISRLRPMIVRLPINLRAVAIGLITTWLPCGWLYLFILVAASTGNVGVALLVMFAFWIGTLPALTALVAGAVGVSPRFRPAMPLLVAGVLIITGIYTASGRAATDLLPLGEAARRYADDDSSLTHPGWMRILTGLSSEPLPCCDPTEVDSKRLSEKSDQKPMVRIP
ncbi:MAG TPA: sulfite exporter TauE/SafE family protein [Planctomycetaceae bacterium]|nr:sulfite exporter TauE/SafE family protein [Planctomycetaceae bacterium]